MDPVDLVRFLQHKAREYHRGTVQYDGSDIDILYLRDDIREERLLSQIDRMLKRIRPEATSTGERSFPFGDMHATVRIFDEAIILHFPTGTDTGTVVSLAPETARDLNTFIGECMRRIRS